MTRAELIRSVALTYSAEPEYPWHDDNCVFRHAGNRKWFALVLRVPYRRLGLNRDGWADLVNLKCNPLLMGSYRDQPGVLPGYHMNKEHWLSVLLDGSAEDEALRELLAISYELTRGR